MADFTSPEATIARGASLAFPSLEGMIPYPTGTTVNPEDFIRSKMAPYGLTPTFEGPFTRLFRGELAPGELNMSDWGLDPVDTIAGRTGAPAGTYWGLDPETANYFSTPNQDPRIAAATGARSYTGLIPTTEAARSINLIPGPEQMALEELNRPQPNFSRAFALKNIVEESNLPNISEITVSPESSELIKSGEGASAKAIPLPENVEALAGKDSWLKTGRNVLAGAGNVLNKYVNPFAGLAAASQHFRGGNPVASAGALLSTAGGRYSPLGMAGLGLEVFADNASLPTAEGGDPRYSALTARALADAEREGDLDAPTPYGTGALPPSVAQRERNVLLDDDIRRGMLVHKLRHSWGRASPYLGRVIPSGLSPSSPSKIPSYNPELQAATGWTEPELNAALHAAGRTSESDAIKDLTEFYTSTLDRDKDDEATDLDESNVLEADDIRDMWADEYSQELYDTGITTLQEMIDKGIARPEDFSAGRNLPNESSELSDISEGASVSPLEMEDILPSGPEEMTEVFTQEDKAAEDEQKRIAEITAQAERDRFELERKAERLALEARREQERADADARKKREEAAKAQDRQDKARLSREADERERQAQERQREIEAERQQAVESARLNALAAAAEQQNLANQRRQREEEAKQKEESDRLHRLNMDMLERMRNQRLMERLNRGSSPGQYLYDI